MELIDANKKRRTAREFKNLEVPRSIIEFAIENGFETPAYNHLKEWDFIILNSMESKCKLIESQDLDKSLDVSELERLFNNIETIEKEMYLDAIPKQKKMILEAPSVVLVVFKPKTKIEKARRIYDLNCVASVWSCIENFLYSLAEHEVYGVTFIPQNIEAIKDKLQIPYELEIAAIIPIGYRADNERILKLKTVNVAERIHLEKW